MNAAAASTSTRQTADERRDEIIAAALHAFASGGYAGTSTDTIARAVGVSQPYLFQLFGTKRELFLAVVRHASGRVRLAFEEAVRRGPADGIACSNLELMGHGLHGHARRPRPAARPAPGLRGMRRRRCPSRSSARSSRAVHAAVRSAERRFRRGASSLLRRGDAPQCRGGAGARRLPKTWSLGTLLGEPETSTREVPPETAVPPPFFDRRT